MTAFNFAQGGDIHYNENYALYPQNAFVEGRPEYGSSTTLLKPAHHWEGGHYAPVRHMSLNDECHQCALSHEAAKLRQGDTFLTHIIPSMSLATDFHYVIHTPLEGASFTVRLAAEGTVLGTIDGSVAGDGWFQIPNGGVYIPSTGNDAIEFVLDAWPDNTPEAQESDPCGVFGPCEEPWDFCFTTTAFYKHARAEEYCSPVCWDGCDC